MSKSGTPDIWLILDRSRGALAGVVACPPATGQPVAVKQTRWQQAKKRAGAIGLDIVATAWWVYLFLQLFVVDLRATIPGGDDWSARSIALFRIAPLAVATVVVATFFWRWKAFAKFLYIAFFPLVVVCWKLPQFIVKRRLFRSAASVMAALNALTLAAKNLRYHLLTKSAAVLALILIVCIDNRVAILTGGTLALAWLVWALLHVLSQTFQSNSFVDSQRKLVTLVARVTDQPLQVSITPQPDGTVTQKQAEEVSSTIQSAAVWNRLLYLWAYKLQEYRESSLVLAFNFLSYFALFFGSIAALFLMNLAVLRAFPAQYSWQSHPSIIAVFLYSLSSMVLADGGRISASGDIAYLLRIVAGLYGPVFLLSVVVNTLFVLRGSRDDTDLRKTVRDLKQRARKHEERFADTLHVGIDEACERLFRLGIGNHNAAIAWLREAIPSDFISGSEVGPSPHD